jgi:hypothetical protein
MTRALAIVCAIFIALLGNGRASAQQQIGIDPYWGPICASPFGPGRCDDVRRWIAIMQLAPTIQLQMVGQDMNGPICAGPLGPSYCQQIQVWIATQQIAAQEIQLRQVASASGGGAFCMGPFGPGPCDAIRAYLMQVQTGVGPFGQQPIDARNVQLANAPGGASSPMCQGPAGPVPCMIAAQLSLDQFQGAIPAPASFGLPSNLTQPQQIAAECARRVGLDVAAFAGCTGQSVILPQNQQAVVDCAASSKDAPAFASCAAPALGIRLSDDQRVLAGCAVRAKGDVAQFATCAGGRFVNRSLNSDERAILGCAATASGSVEAFASCAGDRFFSQTQAGVLNCAINSSDAAAFAACAAPLTGVRMSDDQRILARCAMSSGGDRNNFLTCAGGAFLNRSLGPNEQAVLGCAATSDGKLETFAACSGTRLFGSHLSREQTIAIECAAQSQGDVGQMAACGAANMFNLQLNPEQQIAVQCVVGSGGNPPAAAGCIATRLSARELTKCLTDGIGGRGCFGDNNDLVGRNGWVRRTFGEIAGGPNSLINNPSQVWGGDNSFVRNPGQIFGGSNSFVRNPSQIWGGNNSIFNNPGQLIPQPRPVQLGTVGGKRICLPWC